MSNRNYSVSCHSHVCIDDDHHHRFVDERRDKKVLIKPRSESFIQFNHPSEFINLDLISFLL